MKKHPTLPISFERDGRFICGDRVRRSYTLSSGYRRIMISGKPYYLHILMLETFVGPRPKGKVARFKHGRDIHIDNLYWGERPWDIARDTTIKKSE